jgi:hypothetical protein
MRGRIYNREIGETSENTTASLVDARTYLPRGDAIAKLESTAGGDGRSERRCKNTNEP